MTTPTKMRHLRLTEYQTEPSVLLSPAERDALRDVAQIAPTRGELDRYDVTPGSTIGVMEFEALSVEIRPKLPISRVMFLISYALNPSAWRDTGFDYGEEDSLLEALIPGFVLQVRQALRRGLLQGYQVEEEALVGVRGRIRFDDQLRFRFGIAPPVEVRFDDFTEDIEVNRLVKAAIRRLGSLRIRSAQARLSLRSFDQALMRVSDVEYDPRRLPEVSWNRLNSHYRPAVELAKLILRSSSIELRQGQTQSATFLVDMNKVFEDFVVVALREALQLSEGQFPQGLGRSRLDRAGRVRLEPDISWWEDGDCVFVGDVKYKKVRAEGVNNPDLYQLLAYVVANRLPVGLLIYAAGEDEPAVHEIVYIDRRIEVMTLDLLGDPDRILGQIQQVAQRVEQLRPLASVASVG
jgi:5-methylcytosine-specific restriction enzyme subunit McrC